MNFFKQNYLGGIPSNVLKLDLNLFAFNSFFFFKKMNSVDIKTSYVLNYLTSKVSVVSMLSFLFLSKKFSKNLIVTLNFFLKESLIFIKKRVKFKGLGFRIKSISSKL